MKDIRAIIFDLDNTLIDLDKHVEDALRLICNQIGITFEREYLTYFDELDHMLWTQTHPSSNQINQEDIPVKRFELFFSHFGIEYNDVAQANVWFKEGLVSHMYPIEDAETILKKLKKLGYQIYVLTNGLISLQMPRIIHTNLIGYIDKVYVSEEIGYSKPNSKAFLHVLNDNHLNKKEVIMIGDSLENDIQGANELGIQSIWYNPKKVMNETKIKPTKEVTKLTEILSWCI